jgi:hypothetical protein
MVWLDSTRTEGGDRDVRRPSRHERRWGAEEHDFAAACRSQPKWVVSRTLKSVGPNATLVEDDIEAMIVGLKVQLGLFFGDPVDNRAICAVLFQWKCS